MNSRYDKKKLQKNSFVILIARNKKQRKETKTMYEYNSETKTLTLNEWGEIGSLPSDIKKEAEHLICRKRITSDIYLTRGLMELCMLKDMLICDENPEYKTVDGIIYSKDGSKLLFCPAGITGDVRVLDGTKIICKNSFTSSRISEITIPDSVEVIDDAAFASSISLEHVYFSEGSKLMAVGSNAFYGCKALRQIILPDSVEHMKSKIFKNSGIKTFAYPDNAKLVVEDDLFVNCPIKDVTVPKILYEQKGVFYFLNPCLSDYSMYLFYETDDKEFTEAITLTVKGFKPLAIPRYVKPGSFDKFTDDVNAFFSNENSEAPDLYKYGGSGIEKEDTALLQYKLYQTKSSRRYLVLNARSIAERKAEESEESMAELVTLDIWKPDILEYMLKIVQEKEYLSLIAYILEKLPKRKSNVNL